MKNIVLFVISHGSQGKLGLRFAPSQPTGYPSLRVMGFPAYGFFRATPAVLFKFHIIHSARRAGFIPPSRIIRRHGGGVNPALPCFSVQRLQFYSNSTSSIQWQEAGIVIPAYGLRTTDYRLSQLTSWNYHYFPF